MILVDTSVWVDYLRARHTGMSAHHFFSAMKFSTDRAEIASWAPLLTESRDDTPIAATNMPTGTDVNFGAVSQQLLNWLSRQAGCGVASSHRVIDLNRRGDRWDDRWDRRNDRWNDRWDRYPGWARPGWGYSRPWNYGWSGDGNGVPGAGTSATASARSSAWDCFPGAGEKPHSGVLPVARPPWWKPPPAACWRTRTIRRR